MYIYICTYTTYVISVWSTASSATGRCDTRRA